MNRYILTTAFTCLILLTGFTGNCQIESDRKAIYAFAHQAENYLEGFNTSHPGNDFSYHSFRNDLTESLLTRCTNGKMKIEWETESIQQVHSGNGAGFIWITAIDMTSDLASFDVKVDGIQRFTIQTGSKENFELTTEDGGKLSFIMIEKDQHADAHGYMSLWAPESWLHPGKPLTVSITGSASQSNSWIIVYKAMDAAVYLRESVKYNAWTQISIHHLTDIEMEFPSNLVNRTLKAKIGKKPYAFMVQERNGLGYARLESHKVLSPNSSFALSDEYGDLVDIASIGESGTNTQLAYKALLQSSVIQSGTDITIKAERIYKPKTVSSLKALADSKLSGGTIYLMNSSHQDIAWMDSPEKCILLRDTMLLTPLLERAKSDTSYRFDIEDALMIKEYISRHPEAKPLVAELLEKGRISCGSSYNQPYEEIYSGEALARQFYFGSRWLKKEFGYQANTYWNQDVPGRTLQMPQILRKSGNEYLALSRMEKGIFNWYSPDGSYITTYSAGHYGNDFTPLQRNFYEAAEYIARNSMTWADYFQHQQKKSAIPLFSDWDMSPAKDYSNLIRQWNQIQQIKDGNGRYADIDLPEIRLSLTPDFLKEFCSQATDIPARKGERPAVWLYIHGPTHQKAIKASREADILLTAAEKFATANALVSKSFAAYPEKQLNDAWEARLYPDHGWGGKHGDITDALFQEKYYQAESTARQVLNNQLSELASGIVTQKNAGIPLIVFNSMSTIRSAPVSIDIRLDKAVARQLQMNDAAGNRIPCQWESIQRYDDGSFKEGKLCFIGNNIPSIGYKTFYLIPASDIEDELTEAGTHFENRFYKIELTRGGIASLYDKESGEELLDTTFFKGAEVFALHSEGTGAGEFADIQQPGTKEFVKASNYASAWRSVLNGPVFTEYLLSQPIMNAHLEERIRIYHSIKKIDIGIELKNYEGILYREYRMALPLRYKTSEISYEVPFGVLNIGKDELEGSAGERYTSACQDIHPRGIGNWISVNSDISGITMSSSVAVMDYIDPVNKGNKTVLQPILISSRKSCHEEGNEYLQTGNHEFGFSLTSHQSGWKHGYIPALSANEKLFAVLAPKAYQSAFLPEEGSFFSSGSDEVLITTVKMQEDKMGAVIRLVNLSNESRNVEMKWFQGIKSCLHADLLENPLESISTSDNRFNYTIGKAAIETFIIQ